MKLEDIANDNVAIVGVGLVGGAILREIINYWYNTISGLETARHIGKGIFSNISITALTQKELIYQLIKTITVSEQYEGLRLEGSICNLAHLIRAREIDYGDLDITQKGVEEIIAEGDGRFNLTINSEGYSLPISAETLNILPQGLTAESCSEESFRRNSEFFNFISRVKPKTLIVGVNLASLIAYANGLDGMSTLGWISTTLLDAIEKFGIERYVDCSTTALGGLGIRDIIWTHQSPREMDGNLIEKVIAAFGETGILKMASLTVGSNCNYTAVKPGALLGVDYVRYGKVRAFKPLNELPETVSKDFAGGYVPLYEPVKIDPNRTPTDKNIDWGKRRLAKDDGPQYLQGVLIKCGETGDISPSQFTIISHPKQMGFISDVYIAKVIMKELLFPGSTGYNTIDNGGIIQPDAYSQEDRKLILGGAYKLEKSYGNSPAVYPALGSPRAQKWIVEARLLEDFLSANYSTNRTFQQIAELDAETLSQGLWDYVAGNPKMLAEITAVIPIITPDGSVYSGPHIMYLSPQMPQGLSTSSDLMMLTQDKNFRDFAVFGAVDLRPVKEQVTDKRVYETGVGGIIDRCAEISRRYTTTFSDFDSSMVGTATIRRSKLGAPEDQFSFVKFSFVNYLIESLPPARSFVR
ncbi:hypothetical protein KY347_01580 [Candidatus Woesearchaeota archaeon]|nr:hypothetical protein [Candidatus Woesearchaeota archaeon]